MGENVKNILGRRIKQRRKILGITQLELAEKIDVDAKYISRIETGTSNPSLNTVEKIADVMKIETASLFKPYELQDKDEIIEKLSEKLKNTSLKNAQIIYEISERILSI